MGSGIEEQLLDPQLPGLVHAPRHHALAPDPVLVLGRGLEHHDLLAVAGQGGRPRAADTAADDDHVNLAHLPPSSAGHPDGAIRRSAAAWTTRTRSSHAGVQGGGRRRMTSVAARGSQL